MPRRLDHIEAAADEAIKLGASFDYEMTSKNIVAIVGYRGKTRKVFMSCNPHSHSSNFNVRADVRKQVEGMKG